MRNTQPHHIRKPVLIGLGVVFFTLFLHLIGVYLYSGGHYVGLRGGSTSIGIIGDAPDLMKPLNYGNNPSDQLVYRFLFRGLIRYNPEDSAARSDLAECDISKLERITCTLKKNGQWSDRTIIQDGDVVATYHAFATRDNPPAGIKSVKVEAKNGTITFTNPSKDPQVLELLSYPIFRSDMIEQIKTGRFASGNLITSGQYTFGEQTTDPTYGYKKISLIQNPNTSENPAWFEKISIKFFDSLGAITTAQDTLGVVVPPVKNKQVTFTDRLKPYTYTTYEYYGAFFHTDRLAKNLRNILHWQLATSLSGTLADGQVAVNNIFSGYPAILPEGNIGNFPDIMKKNGYMKRDDWVTTIESTPTTITGGIVYDAPRFFSNKANVLFVSDVKGGLLLAGKFDKTIESVIINGYQLQEFKPGNVSFSYRVALEDNTIKEGKNTYLLEGKKKDGTATGEVLTVYYTPDENKMAEYKQSVDNEYIARNNTPALIAEREREKQTKKETAMKLDPLYYYDKDGTPFRIKLAYITGLQSTEPYALAAEKTLKNLSILTDLTPLDPKTLQEMIKTGKKDYDILIAGVSAGDTLSSIGQLFAASNAGKGLNLSNIESPKLDSLFVDLRSAPTPEQQDPIKKSIISIMQSESFFFPISSPLHTLYIDRNLKGIRHVGVIPGTESLYDLLEFASIKDAYVFNTDNKSFTQFFAWMSKLLF